MVRFLVLVLIGMAPLFGDGPTAGPTARIAAYQDDRAGAISYTFDDGFHSQMVEAVPMLRAHGFHGTFFIIGSRVAETKAELQAKHLLGGWGSISWEEMRELAAQGDEIANHTWSHPHLPSLDDAAIRTEIDKCDDIIFEKVGIRPLTICYPGNAYDDRVRKIGLEKHLNDRNYATGLSGPEFTNDFAIEWVDDLIHNHGWGVTMIHEVLDTDPAQTRPEILKAQMDYVKSRESDVWVDTFLNVTLYTKERDAAKLTVTPDAGKLRLMLESPLPNPPYDFPLTVVVAWPGATQVSASRGATKIPVRVGKDQVQFDAVPGPEPIVLR